MIYCQKALPVLELTAERPSLEKGANFFTKILPDRLFNPLDSQLNPISLLLALLGDHHILHVSIIRVNIKHKQ